MNATPCTRCENNAAQNVVRGAPADVKARGLAAFARLGIAL